MKTWRVGHQGRDRMYYEELHGGVWERIDIDGEMLMGRAHHVIYFASPERWLEYPEWARGRRDEIIARITSEFREPDYEYHGRTGRVSQSGTPETRPSQTAATQQRRASPRATNRALLTFIVALFALAAVMGWLVTNSVARGATRLPLKRATLARTVSRAEEPATFWISVGLYAVVGAGALVLGAYVAREGRRR